MCLLGKPLTNNVPKKRLNERKKHSELHKKAYKEKKQHDKNGLVALLNLHRHRNVD